jgi:hypothetical protein
VSKTLGYTLGSLARRWGVPVWKIRRVFERRLLPEPSRLGNYRVVAARDLPSLERALRKAGYLPAGGPDHAA